MLLTDSQGAQRPLVKELFEAFTQTQIELEESGSGLEMLLETVHRMAQDPDLT